MASPTGRKKSNTFVWAVLGLLVISLTGFGVRQIGSSGGQAVAKVGDESIEANDYARLLSNQLRSLSAQFGTNLTMEQALSFGIDRNVLSQALVTAALDNEDARIGLSVGDTQVQKNLLTTPGFQGLSGKFDQGAYKEALRRANISPAHYDTIIRKNAVRSMLQVAVGGGVQSNDTFALALYTFVGETRNLRWAKIDETLLPEPVRAPNDAEIGAQYQATPGAYTSLETRKITYAEMTPENLVDKIAVDEAALKQLYDDQTTRFHIPARRIVDRLVYPSDEAAKTAFAALLDGTKSFEDLVTARGLTLNDVDLGEVTQDQLGSPAAAEAVFLLNEPGFAGPVETDLGPAVFRVNAVLDAQDTPFEDAKAELQGEYVADRARRQIDDSIGHINDLLAGGATLEEIATQTDMRVSAIDVTTATEDGIAAHEEFRQAASAAVKGDFPKVVTLADGGIFALRLDAIVAPALKPLAEVKDQVIDDWKAAETRKILLELAATAKAQLDAGTDFEVAALTPKNEANIQRQSVIEAAPGAMVTEAFTLENGQTAIVSDDLGIVIVKVTDIRPFDEKDPKNVAAVQTLNRQISNQIGTDIFAAFAASVQEQAGVTINQSVINAVHAQIR